MRTGLPSPRQTSTFWGNWATETWADWDYVALKMREVKGLLEGMPVPGAARSYVPSQYWESVPGAGGSTTNNTTVIAPVMDGSQYKDTQGGTDYQALADELARNL